MNPPITRQLRVKGGGEDSVLADQNRVVAPVPEHLDRFFPPNDPGGADENSLHPRRITKIGREVDLCDRRADLASIGVAFDVDRQHRKAGLCRHHRLREENDTRTGCENRHSRPGPLYDLVGQVLGLHQPEYR